jgi:hypothetical protein
MQMQHRHLNFDKQSTNISEAKQYNCWSHKEMAAIQVNKG